MRLPNPMPGLHDEHAWLALPGEATRFVAAHLLEGQRVLVDAPAVCPDPWTFGWNLPTHGCIRRVDDERVPLDDVCQPLRHLLSVLERPSDVPPIERQSKVPCASGPISEGSTPGAAANSLAVNVTSQVPSRAVTDVVFEGCDDGRLALAGA